MLNHITSPEEDEPAKRDFYIFGDNIAHSLSPTLHNAGFAELGLPHHYSIYQTPSIDEAVTEILKSPRFGGASVTFPHKLAIRSMLNSVSPSASKIGAVNTVVVQSTPSGHVLVGDNTDWIGINQCIEQSKVQLTSRSAVIIGAGGAARAAVYGVQHLGIERILLVNRTMSNAKKLAAAFPDLQFEIFDNFESLPIASAELAVACVPADDFVEEDFPISIFMEKGVLVEMAYRPQTTALMKVVQTKQDWKISRGIDVLKYQAYAQFELWTGKKAPASVMEDALRMSARL